MSADPRDALIGLGERVRTLGRTMTPGALGGRTELASPAPTVAGIMPPVTIGETASGGKEYATLVVAADDSTDHGKAMADYVCDGTNDHLTINDALTDETTRGVVLLEGNYYTAGQITVPSFTWLRGQGLGSQIRRDGGAGFPNIIAQQGESTVSDLYLKDEVYQTYAGVFSFGGMGTVTERVFAEECYWGIWLNAKYQFCRTNVARSCRIGLYDNSQGHCVIDGNIVYRATEFGALLDGDNSVFSNNIIERTLDDDGDGHGITTTSGLRLVITGNRIYQCYGHGIQVSGTDIAVVGNLVTESGFTTGTGDNINIDGVDCMVQVNICRQGADTRYGIRVEAAATDNFVSNNDLRNAGNTADYSDVGTGTITTAGNRT